MSPYTLSFFILIHLDQSAENTDAVADAVAVLLQSTDPRYLFVYPISLMTFESHIHNHRIGQYQAD